MVASWICFTTRNDLFVTCKTTRLTENGNTLITGATRAFHLRGTFCALDKTVKVTTNPFTCIVIFQKVWSLRATNEGLVFKCDNKDDKVGCAMEWE